MRIGSLCSGYGGLEEGVRSVLGGEVVWQSDIDPGACKILAHRYPGIPNIGDMTTVDWAQVEPVDVITGGTPCQDVSAAGKRAGMRAGTRSGLWSSMCDAIDIIRPGLVVWENVRGVLSAHADSAVEPCPICVGDERDAHLRALGRVVGDLAELGYVGRWTGLRAADVGAPHGRFRVFVAAWPAGHSDGFGREAHDRLTERRREPQRNDPRIAGVGVAADADRERHERGWRSRDGWAGSADGGVAAAHAEGHGRHEGRTEPAGLVGGSDAALGGSAAADAAGAERRGPQSDDLASPSGRAPEPGERAGVRAGRGGLDAVPTEARPGEGLRDVWGAVDPQAVPERTTRGSVGLPASPVLLDPLQQHESDTDVEGRPSLAGKTAPEVGVREVRHDDEPARSPRRPGSHEQRPVQSADPLLLLSHEAALAGGPREARGCREEGSGYGCGAWGQYASAVHRWEMVLGRFAPAPTELNAKGSHRLSARAVEFLMGLPAGWVTDVPGLTRNEQLKALGNGVVPQQAAQALRLLLPDVGEVAA